MRLRTLLTLILLLYAHTGLAHPLAPTLYDVKEIQAGTLKVTWKSPRTQAAGAQLRPVFPEICPTMPAGATQRIIDTGLATQFTLSCQRELQAGDEFSVNGLAGAPAGVLLRVQRKDGPLYRQLLDVNQPSWRLPVAVRATGVLLDMFRLGVEHLLGGPDHLLFIFCLVLLVPQTWRLLGLLTAFTVGHSFTLALATLDLIHVPGRLVEVLIAVSILILAAQLGERMRNAGATLPWRRSWVVCLCFGLLHGLGFAGALSEIGLPDGELLTALLGFNLGIEFGQVVVVAATLMVLALVRSLAGHWPTPARLIPIYLIGSIAGYWLFERMMPAAV